MSVAASSSSSASASVAPLVVPAASPSSAHAVAASSPVAPPSGYESDSDRSSAEEDSMGGGCLGDFFMNREYKLLQYELERVRVQCWSLEKNTTDADLTGQILWPGSEIVAQCLLTPYSTMIKRAPELAPLMARLRRGCVSDEQATADGSTCQLCNDAASLSVASSASSSVDAAACCSSSSLPSTFGCHLLHGRRAFEFGSGYGLLGMIVAHFARSVTFSDHSDEVIQLLRRNVQLAEERQRAESNPTSICSVTPSRPQRRLRSTFRVEPLAWGADVDLPPFVEEESNGAAASASAAASVSAQTAAPAKPVDPSEDYSILIGGDIIYDGSIVAILFAMVSRYLDRHPHALFLCGYIVRWNVVEREVEPALRANGLTCVRIPIETFVEQPTPQRFEDGSMLVIAKEKTNDRETQR